jgi:Heterokaryon incompatibility protein (HET)
MECSAKDLDQADFRQRLYKDLPETEYRVVHLLPGKFLDEIQCVLETRPFRVKTRYEALSYVWGDDLKNTKPIRIARSDFSSQSTKGIIAKALPEDATGSLAKAFRDLQAAAKQYIILFAKVFRVLEAAAKRYILPLWILDSLLGTDFLWYLLLPLPVGPPDWLPSFIPRIVYFTLLCILAGGGILVLLGKAFRLMTEVAETKPWGLAHDFSISHDGKSEDGRSLDFETLQVTINLALALRYLRREKRARTLWIDALCINQENKAEKDVQIQRMDLIYANASPIVVWLGGYHEHGEADICAGSSLQEGGDCEHRRQIQAAFYHIWTLSGWRVLLGWYFGRGKDERFQESRSGLCEVARRGWWERLWVIQEVALATGRVEIQCGHNTCHFDDFESAHYSILLKHHEDKALKDNFRPSEHFLATIKDFRYSHFHDHPQPFAKTLSSFMMRVLRRFCQDKSLFVADFHEQPFAKRLNRILIKSAGSFKCHDDRDRLDAVLGIAGGATMGKVTKMASLVETISSLPFRRIVYKPINFFWGTYSLPVKVAICAFAATYSLWGFFYDHRARHWTINRPDYVVAGYRKVIGAVTGGAGERPSRVELFTAIAGYLARETKSLAFLDVATCGEDKDKGMPSWVPNWSREVSKPAYDFISRIKKDQALDIFELTDGGKTLQLTGRSRGTVNIIRTADLNLLRSSPWQGASEKMLFVPNDTKRAALSALQSIGAIIRQRPFSMLSEAEKMLISYSVEAIRLCLDMGFVLLESALRKAGGTIIVYSYGAMTSGIGYLKAGKAVKGDEVEFVPGCVHQLVFVPGCFHHLLLRSRGRTTENPIRWKLVGLVAMAKETTQGKGCSKSEWAQFVEDGVVHNYTIE